jgi:hypothetical protein
MNLFDFMAANNGPQQQQDPADMLGGGGVGLSHGDAMTLSLLNAMQQQAQAGTQRTASPIGSIAQSLGPLLAAPIQARQMEQRSQLQELLLRAKIVELLGKDKADDPAKAAADLAKTQAETARINEEVKYRQNPLGAFRAMLGQGGAASAGTSDTGAGPLPGLGGTRAAGAPNSLAGMRPRFEMGVTGPNISFSSDVMSPEKFAQEQKLANMRADESIRKTTAELDRKEQAARNIQLREKAPQYINPDTLESAPPGMTIGDATDKGYITVDKTQLGALPGIVQTRGALDEIRNLVENAKAGDGKPLFPDSTGSALQDAFNVQANRLRLAARLKGRDPVVSNLQTNTTVGVIPLQRNLAHIGRPPAPEVQALIDSLTAKSETKQSMLSKLDALDDIVNSGVSSMRLSPEAFSARAKKLKGGAAAQSPNSLTTGSGKTFTIEEIQ